MSGKIYLIDEDESLRALEEEAYDSEALLQRSFFAALAEEENPEAVSVARALQDWAKRRGLRFWWGKGNLRGSFSPLLDCRGDTHWTFSAWTQGGVNPQFQHMKAPFDEEAKRRDLQKRLNAISGIEVTEAYLNGRPGLSYTALAQGARVERFQEVFDWYVDQIRAGAGDA